MESNQRPCPYCFEPILDSTIRCPACNENVQGVFPSDGAYAGARVSGTAIASLVCGLLALVTCITGIPAIILGWWSLAHEDGSAPPSRGLAIAGISVGGLSVLLWGATVALFLFAVTIPAVQRARQQARIIRNQGAVPVAPVPQVDLQSPESSDQSKSSATKENFALAAFSSSLLKEHFDELYSGATVLYSPNLDPQRAQIAAPQREAVSLLVKHEGRVLLRGEKVIGITLTQSASIDVQMAALADLEDLEYLDATAMPVKSQSMPHLSDLSRLKFLLLARTQIDGVGLAHLAGLTMLKSLDLNYTKVGDAGIKRLGSLKNLEALLLFDTGVSDTALATLQQLPHLRHLVLSRTQITDTGLQHLEGLSELQLIHLNGTGVTNQGIEQLRAALPNATIRQ